MPGLLLRNILFYNYQFNCASFLHLSTFVRYLYYSHRSVIKSRAVDESMRAAVRSHFSFQRSIRGCITPMKVLRRPTSRSHSHGPFVSFGRKPSYPSSSRGRLIPTAVSSASPYLNEDVTHAGGTRHSGSPIPKLPYRGSPQGASRNQSRSLCDTF